jgi:prepilin-type N-terminal cleavage/methylation domain-containing protein
MRKEKGFSLIELLIVVAIILIIVAIAIPSLLRAKMSANDSSAASTIRTLNTAQVTYAANYPTVGYSPNLKSLGPSAAAPACDKTAACLIDNVLACPSATGCPKSGYNYFMVGAASSASGFVGDYAASASPIVVNSTGTNNFCSTADAVVRSFKTAIPAPTSVPPQLTAPESIANCQTITSYGPLQ